MIQNFDANGGKAAAKCPLCVLGEHHLEKAINELKAQLPEGEKSHYTGSLMYLTIKAVDQEEFNGEADPRQILQAFVNVLNHYTQEKDQLAKFFSNIKGMKLAS